MSEQHVPAAPVVGPEDQPFFDAAKEGRFLIKRCKDCGKTHWYPRPVCPHCFSLNTEWETHSGAGTVYTHSTMLRMKPPFTLAYVTLDDGPTMMTHLVDAPAGQGWSIGQKVQVVFKASEDGTPVPCFRPA